MMSMMLALLQGEEGASIISLLLTLVVGVVLLVGMWKIFTKAGQPGWAAIVPIYNVYVMLQMIGRPWWWLLLMFVPIANIVVLVILWFDLARAFGKGIGFALGLYFLNPIFVLILGFGNAEYVGPPNAMPAGATA
ncbi:MAG: DUF5684 domain-containing protein [Chloroflexota bacterium]